MLNNNRLSSISKNWKLIIALFSIGIFFIPLSETFANQSLVDDLPPTPLPNPLAAPLPDTIDNPMAIWRPAIYDIPLALEPNNHFYFTRPVAANTISWPNPTYLYGSAFYGTSTPHTGVDIVTPQGTPIMAAASGQVIWTGIGLFTGYYAEDDPYGIAVVREHDFGYKGQPLYTVYAHLKESLVTRGQIVNAGEKIALSGRTGLTTAPHLHFEVRLGINDFSNSLNPELWLAPPIGHGVLIGNVSSTWGNYMNNHKIQIISLETGQEWIRYSYGSFRNINNDPYYQENFILSGLPFGNYQITISFDYSKYVKRLYIHPGGVSYFSFNGYRGFGKDSPPINIPISLPIPENQEILTP
jgi:hypothetical protein